MSVPGDDRSPGWTWQTYLYHDGTHLTIPSDNIMATLRKAGSKIQSKGKSTFKSMAMSGLFILEEYCKLLVDDKPIALKEIVKLRDKKYSDQAAAVQDLGFKLKVKRATIGSSKNVRVRPQFDEWSVKGVISVTEPAITEDILKDLFQIAGSSVGLGDWRPSAPKSPGPYGMFTSKIVRVK